MAEFSIIERYCTELGAEHATTRLSVGDDAAVVAVPATMELAVSVDTLVEGVHFFPETAPETLAHKLLAVNLSDMAAMGAQPKWATLAMTLPKLDEPWLSAFSKSLNELATDYDVQLIGGDTTQGPLNLSMNIFGLLPKGKALTRSKARSGDDVYVSNTLGDAALALSGIEREVRLKGLNLENLRVALDTPKPQIDLGRGLLNIASACLDISDGLIADLGHIAKLSKVSFELDINRIPVSAEYRQYVVQGGNLDLALSGGDDYQLAFTARPDRRGEIQQLSEQLNIPLTKIGKVIEPQSVAVLLFSEDQPYELKNDGGYEHFNG